MIHTPSEPRVSMDAARVFVIPERGRVGTYLPIIKSTALILFGVWFVLFQDIQSIASVAIFASAFFFVLFDYLQPPRTRSAASPQPLYAIVIVWLLHSALFRRNEHLVGEDGAFYLGFIAGIIGILTYFRQCTDTLKKVSVFAVLLFFLNILPHHEHNAFHIDPAIMIYRVCFLIVMYWIYVFDSLYRLRTSRKKFGQYDMSNDVERHRFRQWYIMRDTVRVAWIPFLPETGLVLISFFLIFFTVLALAWSKLSVDEDIDEHDDADLQLVPPEQQQRPPEVVTDVAPQNPSVTALSSARSRSGSTQILPSPKEPEPPQVQPRVLDMFADISSHPTVDMDSDDSESERECVGGDYHDTDDEEEEESESEDDTPQHDFFGMMGMPAPIQHTPVPPPPQEQQFHPPPPAPYVEPPMLQPPQPMPPVVEPQPVMQPPPPPIAETQRGRPRLLASFSTNKEESLQEIPAAVELPQPASSTEPAPRKRLGLADRLARKLEKGGGK